jgi:futalosine hydrolase
MKVLVVAATQAEVSMFCAARPEVPVLITGVGMVATTYALVRRLAQEPFDLVVQAGVGGAFATEIALGEVVLVTADAFGDLGAEDHDKYINIFELGLLGKDEPPFTNGVLAMPESKVADAIDLRKVRGITVQTVSGSEPTIARRRAMGHEVESMEGAALHYVCLQERVPFVQVRGISNYVIPRDKSQWKMKDAIINLNKWLIAFIDTVA